MDSFLPSVRDFYCDAEIFITGGSGFIGKALIERLFSSCPNFKKIYLLLREKRGVPVQARINEFTECDLFEFVLQKNPKAFEKVVIVAGDASLPGLGLSKADREKLKNVTVVFHCAASVRFNEPLKKAILLNVRGTREMCILATEMKKLKAFVYVSTAFCNHRKGSLEEMKSKKLREELYPEVEDYETVIRIAEESDEFVLNALSKKFMKFEYNTYLYAKSLAENICKKFEDKLPLVVYRPAITVGYGRKGPLWGWTANLNGPMGTSTAIITGILRLMYCDAETPMDIIMVDCCVNGMLVSGWKRYNLDVGTSVYNATSSKLTIQDLMQIGKDHYHRFNFGTTLWSFSGDSTACFYNFMFQSIIRYVPSSLVIDKCMEWSGRKPRLMKMRRLAQDAIKSLKYFAFTTFDIYNFNYMQLEKLLSHEEREMFYMRAPESTTDMAEFVYRSAVFIQKNILLEDMRPEAKRKVNKRIRVIEIVDKGMKCAFYSCLAYKFLVPYFQEALY